MPHPLSSISLFTGAGGLDLGLEYAGFETKVAVEIDQPAQQTLRANTKHFRCKFPVLSDITALDPSEILEYAGLNRGEAALVAGGPPCQSFSTAGRRNSIGDPRGSLFKNYADVVDYAQPQFFVMENVRGLLSAAIKHRPLRRRGNEHPPLDPDEEPGSAFRVIRSELEDRLGYQIAYGLVDTADYGVPQNRLRVIIIGSRDHELSTADLKSLIPPTHHKKNWIPLRAAIGLTDQEPKECLQYSKERADILSRVPPGKNWRWFRDNPEYGVEYARKIMGGAWSSGGGKVGFFRRLDPDKPSPTLPTSPIQKSTSLCHPFETRPLSVREYAAIQQFPEGFEFFGSTTQKYKQIGNAVPVGLGVALGQAILNLIFERTPSSGQVRLFEARSRYSTNAMAIAE